MFLVGRRCLASFVAAVLLSVACLGQTTATFSTGTPFPTGGHGPTGVAVGDLNGDGIPDLVVCNKVENTVAVLLGNGDGTFRAPVIYDLNPETSAAAVVVADFNNDGKLDVAVTFPHSLLGGDVVILLGNGDGTLGTPRHVPGDYSPIQMLAVDVNGDKNMDLVFGNNGYPSILFGNGDGTFQPIVDLPSTGECFGVAVADFNADGRLDVACVTFNPIVTLEVILQNRDGSFTLGATYPQPDWQYGYGIVAGDLNGDGKADVVMGAYGSGDGGIFFGNGDGTFQPPISLIVGSGATNMLLKDFNNDKLLDLEVGNFEQTSGGLSVYTNPGNGVFNYQQADYLTTAGGTNLVAAGDFNVDGYLDVVSADYNANVVSVFLNTTGPATQQLTAATTGSGTIISGDGLINCGKKCLRRYPTGTTLRLTATPAVGFTLSNWSGCTSHNGNVCTVTLNSTTAVAATFSPATVTFGSLAFSPSTIRNANISVGTLTLAVPAPSGGVTLHLTSSQPRIVAVSSTVYIPGGASIFRFAARPISLRPAVLTITATDGTTTVAGVLNVSPNLPTENLSAARPAVVTLPATDDSMPAAGVLNVSPTVPTENSSKLPPTERAPASANPPNALRRAPVRAAASSE